MRRSFVLQAVQVSVAVFALWQVFAPLGSAAEPSCCGSISPEGRRLEAVLDGMNVESLWLACQRGAAAAADRPKGSRCGNDPCIGSLGDQGNLGAWGPTGSLGPNAAAHEHVNWETGEPDKDADYAGPGRSTHCSAFAAAVGKKLGVYLLRPPEHGQILLANAQAEWFRAPGGKEKGWRELRTAHEAQSLENQGKLVVVVYESPDPHRPGHVAVVRPARRLERLLEQNGPEITQAGQKNYLKTSSKVGFQAHPGAWRDGVRYYAYAIER